MEAVRAFIAIELPDAIRDQLGEIESRLKPRLPARCIRWVKPDSIHLTLKFLGQVPADQIDLITLSARSAVASLLSFTLEVSGSGCFPDLHRPRVVWVGVHEVDPAGRLQSVQRAVEASVEPLGYPPERRPFSPHLTLGRLARDVRPPDLRKVGEVIHATPVGALGKWEVDEIALIKSDLQPSGAVYTILSRIALAGTP